MKMTGEARKSFERQIVDVCYGKTLICATEFSLLPARARIRIGANLAVDRFDMEVS